MRCNPRAHLVEGGQLLGDAEPQVDQLDLLSFVAAQDVAQRAGMIARQDPWHGLPAVAEGAAVDREREEQRGGLVLLAIPGELCRATQPGGDEGDVAMGADATRANHEVVRAENRRKGREHQRRWKGCRPAFQSAISASVSLRYRWSSAASRSSCATSSGGRLSTKLTRSST
jgi:hypothetical protein